MKPSLSTFRRFLTAEEVPRWFGLSLVLIYLVGLGAVGNIGIMQARSDAALYFQRSSRYTMKLLAERLSALAVEGNKASASTPERSKFTTTFQRALRECAATTSVRWIRVVDDRGHVIASTSSFSPIEAPASDEIGFDGGTGEEVPRGALQVREIRSPGQKRPDVFVRARIGGWPEIHSTGEKASAAAGQPADDDSEVHGADAASPDGVPKGKTVLYLEARLPPEPFGTSSSANRAGTLAIVLVVLGALFVVYRCLREQLRGVSRIASRLQLPREKLEDDLSSLRVADTLDAVTASWNELIDLTQRLRELVQRSEADEELSRALERSGGGALAEALCAVPDGIIYITDEVRFEYVNSAARRLFGWSDQQEIVRMTLPEARADGVGGRILDLLREAQQPDGSFEGRSETLDTGDETACDRSSYRVRIFPLHRPHHQGECVVMIRDVSQQVRTERAREEFITQVTHELRTPLTNIRAYAETLSSGMFEDPSVVTECYNVITKETRRLSRLVEDVLSASQMEVGAIDMKFGDVDLKILLSEGVRDVRGLADEKDIDLQLVLPPKLEPVRGDRDKLAVVINNLLGNAIKYTPQNGSVVVGCEFTDEEVVLSVKDDGIGIDPADHARIFEKFQRASDTEVRNETGTGIGLYTAREIVRRHRGEIELISAKGQGATFLVRLPRQKSRSASLTPTKKET